MDQAVKANDTGPSKAGKSQKSLSKAKSNANLKDSLEKPGWSQQAKPGAKNPSNKQSPKHASNAKPDALAKDPKKSGADADKTAKKPPAVGGTGKLNETSEGEDEKYTTEQNEENKDDNYTSQNYTEEYSSAQNKSGNDFNKLNKKFEL